jgi:hypothetical protein
MTRREIYFQVVTAAQLLTESTTYKASCISDCRIRPSSCGRFECARELCRRKAATEPDRVSSSRCDNPLAECNDAGNGRSSYRAYLSLGYVDAFRTLHPGQGGHFTFWDYFRQASEHNRRIRIDHFLLSPQLSSRLESCEIDKGPERK